MGFHHLRPRFTLWLMGVSFLLCLGASARAETLRQALQKAYDTHPTLWSDYSRQRATIEGLDLARSGYRPRFSASGSMGITQSRFPQGLSTTTHPGSVSIKASQPLFDGFKTPSAMDQARASITAGEAVTLAQEQNIFLETTTAFMDVIRDRGNLGLRKKSVEFYEKQLQDTLARYRVGESTNTDVSQVRAHLFEQRAALAQAEALLASSNSAFTRMVGTPPKNLKKPSLPKGLPKSLNEALGEAEGRNPTLKSLKAEAEAARHSIKVVRGDLLPEVSVNGEYAYQHEPSSTVNWSRAGSVYGSVSIPLYDGGSTYARLRAARDTAQQKEFEVAAGERETRDNVIASWSSFAATKLTIQSHIAQVKANRLALEGVRQEASVGSRTTLDVLNAERDLVDSQSMLLAAERDQIVSAYQLLWSIGAMTAKDLKLAPPSRTP